MNDIVIFESDSHQVEVRLEGETLWLSRAQLAELFGRDKSVISRHLKNILETNELERDAVVAKNATTAADGKIYQHEQMVRNHVAQHGRITRQEVIELCRLTPDQAYKLLRRLADEDILEKQGDRKGAYYIEGQDIRPGV